MNEMVMEEMTSAEIEMASGGLTDAEWLGVGMGMVGMGLGIAAAPVGLFGFAVAGALSYGGGAIIGTYLARATY